MTPDPKRRRCRVSFRVARSERTALAAKAEHAGFCLSDYLRQVVLGAKPLRARRNVGLEARLAADLLAALGTVATELRAIASRFAPPVTPALERDLMRGFKALQDCRLRLLQALGKRRSRP